MLMHPMDVLDQFPVRKTRAQKQVFRDAVCNYARKLGYPVSLEKGHFGACNVVIGDPENAAYLVTAHYDTSARLPVPNLITPCHVPLFMLCRLALAVFFFLVFFCAVNGFILLFEDHRFSALLALLCIVFLFAQRLIGPANKHNANDNTSGVVALLEIARTMPENQRKKVCFVLFDLEEAGLVGSAFHRKQHKKATDTQLVLNLDCVGDGDHLRMFPTKKLRKDRRKLTSLYKACGYFGKKSLLVYEKGAHLFPSDQNHFPYGVGICALRKRRKLLYLSRIHTKRDTVLEETNINILRAALTTLICCKEVN